MRQISVKQAEPSISRAHSHRRDTLFLQDMWKIILTERICGKGFRSRSGLRYHEKKHPEENKSVCALCGEPFLLVDDLKKHLKWHIQVLVDYTESHPVHRLVFLNASLLPICGKSFSRSGILISHRFTHTGERPFFCRICGKSFSRSGNLISHRFTHTGEKPFACGICGKSFSQNAHLSAHSLTHTGEKPFSCRICGKSFSRSGSLSSHKLTHTGERPFSCRICGKSFSRSGILISHRICGKGFRSRSGLRYHEKKHPEENKSVCALCGEPFLLVDDLKKHLKWHIQGCS
ncbi:unnamed protein product [Cyprideis torosa]|uniref:Uncharacterized protein n=1 Tax=Cyprideis torosa TaxID=163714 RepID=A0A7R8WSN3_9CRUS|nr:unnamed protein product [Cyprideis torosa]CAG0903937.1 unnamed protein product [Cyprideis torosa]